MSARTDNERSEAGGCRAATCSRLEVMQAVFDALTKEMRDFERIEQKAATDRHWSMADAMKQKRLAFDAALGVAMKGVERAFTAKTKDQSSPSD